ncbi:aldehyde dehydrogenase 3H1 [Microdochium trichocladiopsis]|uniref:Aldehyde dehydrogenase n=1 Tax=Microdochium trichocladiopsis TaxID=1682393 RepID=A0A9P9BR16_9PEZI|nr:aldehyde dehydrogenase 3H1 [Microdochium trichocladiopsis]KAH7031472.1 aldehyde dehydrogenase 3H1 [Microdochium trichocladiopsis]
MSSITTSAYTSREAVDESHKTLFATFATGRTKSLAWRRWQLKQLWFLVADNEERIVEAMKTDLNRHRFETTLGDIGVVKGDVLSHLQHMDEWTADEALDAGFLARYFTGGRIRKDPLGVALIIGAWNFPFALVLQPMIAAITAGCCVMLKPSELPAASQNLLAELVPKYMDPQAVRIVTGGAQETAYILEKRFNHIFFTGSTTVAKFVAAAAAKHLTPTVLELGGQGPGIVTKSADIELAAKRITYAKFQNAGQICVSVNHVFAEPEIADQLVERMKYWNGQYLSKGSNMMCRVINDRNYGRLQGLLDKTSGKVAYTGVSDPKSLFFHPTIVDNVTMDDSLLSEELFGPICPVVRASVDEAVAAINRLPEPLALYIFGRDQQVIDSVLDRTLSGGVTINNVLFHAGMPSAPFGGVGDSGSGAYHGRHGVDAFVHRRAVAHPPSWIDRLMGFTYSPYDDKYLSWIATKGGKGWKRGATLEDEERAGSGGSWGKLLSSSVLAVAVGAVGYAALTAQGQSRVAAAFNR